VKTVESQKWEVESKRLLNHIVPGKELNKLIIAPLEAETPDTTCRVPTEDFKTLKKGLAREKRVGQLLRHL
jgi:hypothetical protein